MNVKQDKSGDGLPITRIETIADASVDGTRVGYAGLKENECRDWLMEPGDILFSHINSVEHIGKCAVYRGVPEKLVHGMNLLCLRTDPAKLLPEFAKYLIRGSEFRMRLAHFINKAVNQASVSIGNLKTISVSVPSLAKQQRIAEVLGQTEELRAKRRTALAQLDALTQAIFLDLFGDPATNPKGWPIIPLDSEIKSVRYGTGSPPDYVEEGLPFIRATNIKDGTINSKDLKRISIQDAEHLRKCKVSFGNLIVVRSGVNTGDCAMVPKDYDGACAAYDLIVELPLENAIFYNFLINSPYGKRYLSPLTRRAAQPHLNADQLRTLTFIAPSVHIKKEFARRVGAMENLRTAHRASLAKLDALFSSLQHRAFQGEL
ncbi:MAG: restriction endonuclease subunit S [Dehalococcoidia bacterium]|nr:restriction endonuclease subunit S [Dehalococcoidia bacterium]